MKLFQNFYASLYSISNNSGMMSVNWTPWCLTACSSSNLDVSESALIFENTLFKELAYKSANYTKISSFKSISVNSSNAIRYLNSCFNSFSRFRSLSFAPASFYTMINRYLLFSLPTGVSLPVRSISLRFLLFAKTK